MFKFLLLVVPCFLIMHCTDKKNARTDSNLIKQSGDGVDSMLSLPHGFRAELIADTLGQARHIAINDNGDIYVKLSRPRNGKAIVAMRDTTNDYRPDEIKYFGTHTGTEVKIYNGYLYHSTPTAIYRYKMKAGELVPASEEELVISGFEEQNQHETKSFTMDDSGYMYVNVGAPSNACQEQTRTPGSPGMDPCPQLEWHGGIWRFDANKPGQTQKEDGYRFTTGIRNIVGISWNHAVNKLYAMMHGRDQLGQLWPKYFTDEQSAELPAEEFLLLKDGANYGWPYAYYDQIQGKMVQAPEYGGDGIKEPTEKYDEPLIGFPGHWAPNDLLFYTGDQFPAKYKNGAFIAFHGSWNRPFQEGFRVVFVPFNGDKPSGDWSTFVDGFKGKKEIKRYSEAYGRPCGLAQGPDGSLYITDDTKGKVWRVTYKEK